MSNMISFLFGWIPDWLIWVIMGVSSLLALNIFIRDTAKEAMADLKNRVSELENRVSELENKK